MNKNSKNIFSTLLVGIILGLILGFFVFSKNNSKDTELESIVSQPIVEKTEDKNTNIYSNSDYNFSLQYPSELSVTEFNEGQGAKTVVFQKGKELYGFQMFITPYKGSEITEARFKQDIPSGVVKDPVEVIIGSGQRALAFLSSNTIMGETREVWFIRNGFLYEVTTYKNLDSWLANILKTISFE